MAEDKRFGPVRLVPGENKGRYPYCHSIYLEDKKIIIDPGSDRKRLKEIRDNEGVDIVWLSHWHEDHFVHLDLFDSGELWMHEEDALPLSDLDVFSDWYGHERGKFDHLREKWRPVMLDAFHFIPRTPTRLLTGGEQIDLGDLTVEVIHAPGHTPGSLCFYFQEPEILFLGDYDLTPFGPFYGDLYSDIEQTIKSIKRLREIPAKKWISSHDKGLFETNPGELWDNYLKVIDKRDEALIDFLKNPKTLEEIANAWLIYGKPRNFLQEEDLKLIELLCMKKHLDRLMNQDKVILEGNYYKLA